ncbi:MAG: VOC family protein [Planctomycetes bacterium]|nr:VOC family protein [Planctomycetota bacterium]
MAKNKPAKKVPRKNAPKPKASPKAKPKSPGKRGNAPARKAGAKILTPKPRRRPVTPPKARVPSRPEKVPPGYRTITPRLVVEGAAAAIDFYRRAFGAAEQMRFPGPDGRILHAMLKIGDSLLHLNDTMDDTLQDPQRLGRPSASVDLFVEDIDEWFARAVDAGAQVLMPVGEMFWGDRYCMLKDPFGHVWTISTHVVDVTPEEMQRRANEFFASLAGGETVPEGTVT